MPSNGAYFPLIDIGASTQLNSDSKGSCKIIVNFGFMKHLLCFRHCLISVIWLSANIHVKKYAGTKNSIQSPDWYST